MSHIALLNFVIVFIVFLAGVVPAEAHHKSGHTGGPPTAPTPVPTPPPVAPVPSPTVSTLQALIDATPSGGTLNIPPGIYREEISITKPIKLYGGSQAEVRGTDVWVNWTRRDLAVEGHPIWSSGSTVPPMTTRQIDGQYNTPTCSDGTHTTCNHPEQVWLDGRWLRQVDRTPNSGEFTVGSDRRVYLADDPSGHLVEVATRLKWINVDTTDTTIYGVTFNQSAGSYQQSSAIFNGSRLTIEHNSFFGAGYAAIAIGASDSKLYGNEISWNGGVGVVVHTAPNLDWQGGIVRFNNRRMVANQSVSDYWYGWEASGTKIVASENVHVSGVSFFDNGGPGLWCDIVCKQTSFTENNAARNLNHGIEFEGGVGPFLIDHNNSTNNKGCGIMVVLGDHVSDAKGTVSNNLLSGNSLPNICKGYTNTEVQPGVTYTNN